MSSYIPSHFISSPLLSSHHIPYHIISFDVISSHITSSPSPSLHVLSLSELGVLSTVMELAKSESTEVLELCARSVYNVTCQTPLFAAQLRSIGERILSVYFEVCKRREGEVKGVREERGIYATCCLFHYILLIYLFVYIISYFQSSSHSPPSH